MVYLGEQSDISRIELNSSIYFKLQHEHVYQHKSRNPKADSGIAKVHDASLRSDLFLASL